MQYIHSHNNKYLLDSVGVHTHIYVCLCVLYLFFNLQLSICLFKYIQDDDASRKLWGKLMLTNCCSKATPSLNQHTPLYTNICVCMCMWTCHNCLHTCKHTDTHMEYAKHNYRLLCM